MLRTYPDKKICNGTRIYSSDFIVTDSSVVTIKSSPQLVSSCNDRSVFTKKIVMINPDYLERNNVRFCTSLNLKSYKSSTLDNSGFNGKHKITQNYPVPGSMFPSDLHNSQRISSQDKIFSVTTDALPSIENKRKAVSLDDICNATTRNPRARIISCSSSGILMKKSYKSTDGMKLKFPSRSPNEEYSLVNALKPNNYVIKLLADHELKSDMQIEKSLSDFFDEIRVEHYDDYNERLVAATHSHDIATLRQLQNEGLSLKSCNRLGESLLHIACQRGFADVVKFIVKEGKATLRIRNDYGRTPLHDGCLSPSPNFTLIEFLMEEEPALLFIRDSKGFIPIDYVRREHWDNWVNFLGFRKELILDGWERYCQLN